MLRSLSSASSASSSSSRSSSAHGAGDSHREPETSITAQQHQQRQEQQRQVQCQGLLPCTPAAGCGAERMHAHGLIMMCGRVLCRRPTAPFLDPMVVQSPVSGNGMQVRLCQQGDADEILPASRQRLMGRKMKHLRKLPACDTIWDHFDVVAPYKLTYLPTWQGVGARCAVGTVSQPERCSFPCLPLPPAPATPEMTSVRKPGQQGLLQACLA